MSEMKKTREQLSTSKKHRAITRPTGRYRAHYFFGEMQQRKNYFLVFLILSLAVNIVLFVVNMRVSSRPPGMILVDDAGNSKVAEVRDPKVVFDPELTGFSKTFINKFYSMDRYFIEKDLAWASLNMSAELYRKYKSKHFSLNRIKKIINNKIDYDIDITAIDIKEKQYPIFKILAITKITFNSPKKFTDKKFINLVLKKGQRSAKKGGNTTGLYVVSIKEVSENEAFNFRKVY